MKFPCVFGSASARPRRRRGLTSSSATAAAAIESLEDRTLLSTAYWTGEGDNDAWSNKANWSGDVGEHPLVAVIDTAVFDGDATVTVGAGTRPDGFDGARKIIVTGGTVTFTGTRLLAGHLGDSSTSVDSRDLETGFEVQSGTLVLNVAEVRVFNNALVGGDGVVQVNGQLNVNHDLVVEGTLEIGGDASVECNTLTVGEQSAGVVNVSGQLTVKGMYEFTYYDIDYERTVYSTRDVFVVGDHGQGTLDLKSGATVKSTGIGLPVRIGAKAGSHGRLSVASGAVFDPGGYGSISVGFLGSGNFDVHSGGKLRFASDEGIGHFISVGTSSSFKFSSTGTIKLERLTAANGGSISLLSGSRVVTSLVRLTAPTLEAPTHLNVIGTARLYVTGALESAPSDAFAQITVDSGGRFLLQNGQVDALQLDVLDRRGPSSEPGLLEGRGIINGLVSNAGLLTAKAQNHHAGSQSANGKPILFLLQLIQKSTGVLAIPTLSHRVHPDWVPIVVEQLFQPGGKLDVSGIYTPTGVPAGVGPRQAPEAGDRIGLVSTKHRRWAATAFADFIGSTVVDESGAPLHDRFQLPYYAVQNPDDRDRLELLVVETPSLVRHVGVSATPQKVAYAGTPWGGSNLVFMPPTLSGTNAYADAVAAVAFLANHFTDGNWEALAIEYPAFGGKSPSLNPLTWSGTDRARASRQAHAIGEGLAYWMAEQGFSYGTAQVYGWSNGVWFADGFADRTKALGGPRVSLELFDGFINPDVRLPGEPRTRAADEIGDSAVWTVHYVHPRFRLGGAGTALSGAFNIDVSALDPTFYVLPFGNQAAHSRPLDWYLIDLARLTKQVEQGFEITLPEHGWGFVNSFAFTGVMPSYAVYGRGQLVILQPNADIPLPVIGPFLLPSPSEAGGWHIAMPHDLGWDTTRAAVWSPKATWVDILSGDVDGNDMTDVLGRTAAGEWWVTRNAGPQTVTQWWGAWSNKADWKDVRLADVNDDGLLDIVGRANGQWWVARSTGTKFVNELWGGWSATADWRDVLIGDFNGDGKQDIASRMNGSWWVAASDGSRFVTTRWAGWSTKLTWVDIAAADFDGDGKTDLVGRVNGAWWVSRSLGTSFVSERWGSNKLEWKDVRIADVDGDGKADIVGRANDQWWVARSTGTTLVNAAWGSWSAKAMWQDVRIADINGDGKQDIIARVGAAWWAAISTGERFTNHKIGSWSTTASWSNMLIGDIDGNGFDDLIARAL